MHVTSKSLNAINEFRKYRWVENLSGGFGRKPIDDFNHIIDPLRYVAENKLTVKSNRRGTIRAN